MESHRSSTSQSVRVLGAGTSRDLFKDLEDAIGGIIRGYDCETQLRLLQGFQNALELLRYNKNESLKLHVEICQEIVGNLMKNCAKPETSTSVIVLGSTSNGTLRPSNKRRRSQSEGSTDNAPKKSKMLVHFDSPEDWKELQKLGQGAFGSVMLVQENSSGLVCARKTIKIGKLESQLDEINIHRHLKHPNVVEFLGESRDEQFLYIYLEYAGGGNLRDKIGATGMPENKAKFYFRQLIAGVKYLHSMGVMHRDLKPANLMLSEDEVLKIGDFGLAEKFKEGEFLSRVCGTWAYTAPEVFTRRYQGAPADVWSCGIILVRLLTNRLPWKTAKPEDLDYEVWLQGTYEARLEEPWLSLTRKTFHFVKRILVPCPKERATIFDIEQHQWFQG